MLLNGLAVCLLYFSWERKNMTKLQQTKTKLENTKDNVKPKKKREWDLAKCESTLISNRKNFAMLTDQRGKVDEGLAANKAAAIQIYVIMAMLDPSPKGKTKRNELLQDEGVFGKSQSSRDKMGALINNPTLHNEIRKQLNLSDTEVPEKPDFVGTAIQKAGADVTKASIQNKIIKPPAATFEDLCDSLEVEQIDFVKLCKSELENKDIVGSSADVNNNIKDNPYIFDMLSRIAKGLRSYNKSQKSN